MGPGRMRFGPQGPARLEPVRMPTSLRPLILLLFAAALGVTAWLLLGEQGADDPVTLPEDDEVVTYEREDGRLRRADQPVVIRLAEESELARLTTADNNHELPREVEDFRIEHPSGREWTMKGGEILKLITTEFPGIPIAFENAAVRKAFEGRAWPRQFPSHVHLGMLVTSFPDAGFEAKYRNNTLFIVLAPDQRPPPEGAEAPVEPQDPEDDK